MSVPAGFHVLPLSVLQLSLPAVLKCGQSFRWSVLPLSNSSAHEYRLCLHDRLVCLRQSTDSLFYRAVFPHPQPTPAQLPLRHAETLLWLRDYFQLDIDLEALYDQWAADDSVFATFRTRFAGVRMLRQDPWENLVSFICSSNNNISRITKMVQNLCKHYSPPLVSEPDPSNPTEIHSYHPFPPPSALARPDVATTLRSLGFGYRANFIQRTAQMLVDTHGVEKAFGDPMEMSQRWLVGLRTKPTTDARTELLKFIGVGRKVADCVLLMSLDKKEVIPVDTHVHQIAVKHYGMKGNGNGKGNMTPKLYDDINVKFFGIWGEYAGWAHSVLFTADLKSFSTYGLPPPSPSTPQKRTKAPKSPQALLPTPPATPAPLAPLKRKHTSEVAVEDYFTESLSLAERVKKRRRVVTNVSELSR